MDKLWGQKKLCDPPSQFLGTSGLSACF